MSKTQEMMMVLHCDCDDWEKGLEPIMGVTLFAQKHGLTFDFLVFRYCPWCGKRLVKKTTTVIGPLSE